MDNALRLENLYHVIMLEEKKGEEEKMWENCRHTLMVESIVESCNYYGSRNCNSEREIEK